jgi:glucose-6-phosphate 1-dehydrogenase
MSKRAAEPGVVPPDGDGNGISVPLQVPESLQTAAHHLKMGEPCTMVIFGAGGDLARRKLLPALAHLHSDELLDDRFDIIGVAREDIDDRTFRDRMSQAVRDSEDAHDVTDDVREDLIRRLHYVRGDLNDDATYARVGARLRELEDDGGAARGRLFYLAIPPSVYETTVRSLAATGLASRRKQPLDSGWARVIIEKPFGQSCETAKALNRTVEEAFAEHQVYRIDHYLGKETVQNLLVFRFANSIFEPVWNRAHVHHVQITASETVGVEHRGGYYEEAGVVRDMFQNHLLQLLCLTAMEPPTAFRADPVRDEKLKVLEAIRPFTADRIERDAVRGQYGPARIGDEVVAGYREEPRVAKASKVPTFAAARLYIDNWRWNGVPFFLRSGKRLARRATEITVQFRLPPHLMFPTHSGRDIQPNRLTFRIQPDEGISLCMEIKVPGIGVRMTAARMDFGYEEAFGDNRHSAYETLLLDAMAGDQTLFARSDAVEAAWQVVDPLIAAWEAEPADEFPNYPAGSWGPAEADRMIAADGARWRRP